MTRLRIDRRGRVTLPEDVLRPLGLQHGDEVAAHIVSGQIVLTRGGDKPHTETSPFGLFAEWAGEADCRAFDNL